MITARPSKTNLSLDRIGRFFCGSGNTPGESFKNTRKKKKNNNSSKETANLSRLFLGINHHFHIRNFLSGANSLSLSFSLSLSLSLSVVYIMCCVSVLFSRKRGEKSDRAFERSCEKEEADKISGVSQHVL